jgi:hypothetical protein
VTRPPETASLAAIADQLIAPANPERGKELLGPAHKDIRVQGQHTIIPAYRFSPAVRTVRGTVDASGRRLDRKARVEALRQTIAPGKLTVTRTVSYAISRLQWGGLHKNACVRRNGQNLSARKPAADNRADDRGLVTLLVEQLSARAVGAAAVLEVAQRCGCVIH